MRLYEFAGADPMITKLVAVSDQLKLDLEKGKADPNMSVPDFLQYLKNIYIIPLLALQLLQSSYHY